MRRLTVTVTVTDPANVRSIGDSMSFYDMGVDTSERLLQTYLSNFLDAVKEAIDK